MILSCNVHREVPSTRSGCSAPLRQRLPAWRGELQNTRHKGEGGGSGKRKNERATLSIPNKPILFAASWRPLPFPHGRAATAWCSAH